MTCLALSEQAYQGGTDEIAKRLPEGWETILGGWFNKGQQLSGGQWQRVAPQSCLHSRSRDLDSR